MANLDATLWNDLQLENAINEKRFAELGIIDATLASTQSVNFITPSAREALQTASSLRNVKLPAIKDQSVTVVQTPGFNQIPANLPESAEYSFVAYDVFSGFRHYPAQFANNTLDSDFTKFQVMNNVAYQMGITAESIISSVLEARKTQVLNYTTQINQGDGTFTFDGGTDTLTIDNAAQKETMFPYLNTLMEANELPGNYRVVTNRAGMAPVLAEYAKYGQNNDKNLQGLGMISLDRIHQTGNISAGSDQFNGFYLRDGSIGVYENFPFDFRNGTMIDGRSWSITDQAIPHLNMRCNVYTNSQATEATALVGAGEDSNLIMTHFEEMAIWARFYIVFPYNSDLSTRASDIVKIAGSVKA